MRGRRAWLGERRERLGHFSGCLKPVGRVLCQHSADYGLQTVGHIVSQFAERRWLLFQVGFGFFEYTALGEWSLTA